MSDDKENESGNGETPTWERKLVHELALSALAERRRARRWGIFFKFLAFAYLILLLVLWMPDELRLGTVKAPGEHTAVVEVQGVIAPGAKASADRVIAGLREAFEDKRTKGVIVRINSPWGSPVQAGYIHDEILRLRKKHQEIPLHAVVTDICASGGYYIAAAADKIYVDKASVVGAIGVLMNGFGFVDAMETLGIERRLLTAGEHKGIMDPFSPVELPGAGASSDVDRQYSPTVHSGGPGGQGGAPERGSDDLQRSVLDRRGEYRAGTGRCARQQQPGGP